MMVRDETSELLNIVNSVFLSSAVGLFGIIANTINIVIFVKQGLNNTVNISLLGLAISDLCSLITLQWINICMNPLVINSDIPMVTEEVQSLTGDWPHDCFTRITEFITVYITAERCLSVVVPLKVKQIVTPRRTTVIIISINVLVIASLVPTYISSHIGWRFYPERNRSLLALMSLSNYAHNVEALTFLLFAIYIVVGFGAVIVFTSILVLKLKSKTNWRMKNTLSNGKSMSVSGRDRRTITMVILIASVMIMCYAPAVVLYVISFIEPEFMVGGKYTSAYFAGWSFALLFDAINSSVNIFMFYNMSSNYRQTFKKLFARRRKRDDIWSHYQVTLSLAD